MCVRFLMWVLAPLLCGAAILSTFNVPQSTSKPLFAHLPVQILVARRNVDLGETITDPTALFEVKTVIGYNRPHPSCSAHEIDRLKGGVLNRAIAAGHSFDLEVDVTCLLGCAH